MNYDPIFNTHEVIGIMTEDGDEGYYIVTVHGNYTDIYGNPVKFTRQFVQTILPACPITELQNAFYIEDWNYTIRYTEEPDPYDPSLP